MRRGRASSRRHLAAQAGCWHRDLFLHSYRNPASKAPSARCQIADLKSSARPTWPIIREYERTITTVISGYVQPRVAHYLDRFEAVLRAEGVACPLLITKTNGGVMGIDQAKAECVQMILSGTASGVIGAGYLAKHCGFPRILSLDIGGTSADVAVVIDGQAQYGTGELIGDFQIHVPSVSVSSVGQGGSIAWPIRSACYRSAPVPARRRDPPAQAAAPGSPMLWSPAPDRTCRSDTARSASTTRRGRRCPLRTSWHRVEEAAGNIIDISVSGMYAKLWTYSASALIRALHLFAFGARAMRFLAREPDMLGSSSRDAGRYRHCG